MGAQDPQRILAEYNRDSITHRLLDLYDQVICSTSNSEKKHSGPIISEA